jgi:hypothetical protein
MRSEYYSPALTTYTRINNGHMKCLLGEVAISSTQYEGSLEDILRLDRMADIYDICFRVDAQDGAFYGPDVTIGVAKISSQGYWGTHLWILSLRSGKNSENDKQDGQNYGQFEKGAFYAPPSAVHRVSLPEDAPYASTAQLE